MAKGDFTYILDKSRPRRSSLSTRTSIARQEAEEAKVELELTMGNWRIRTGAC